MSMLMILLFCVLICGISSQSLPTQVHIAIAGTGSRGIAVCWEATEAIPTALTYGLEKGALTNSVSGESKRYLFNSYQSGFLHEAVIPGPLEPDTLYFCKPSSYCASSDAS
jgi:hypothetical protein